MAIFSSETMKIFFFSGEGLVEYFSCSSHFPKIQLYFLSSLPSSFIYPGTKDGKLKYFLG
jgi:hypothetical protein